VLPKWAWSGWREQCLHCELRKFCYSKASVNKWNTQFDHRQCVYDTWNNGSWVSRVTVKCTLSITHCLQLNVQLYTIDLAWTCCINKFGTVMWQLTRFPLTRRIVQSLGDSWPSYVLRGSTANGILLVHSDIISHHDERTNASKKHQVDTHSTTKIYINRLHNTSDYYREHLFRGVSEVAMWCVSHPLQLIDKNSKRTCYCYNSHLSRWQDSKGLLQITTNNI